MRYQSRADLLRRPGRAERKASRRRRGVRPLTLEALEPRRLLSVSVAFGGGVLSVLGNLASDWIQVTDHGDGSVVVACPSDPLNAAPKTFQGVAHVTISAGDGDNRVDYQLDGTALPQGVAFRPASVDLHTGLGADNVSVGALLPAVQYRESDFNFLVDLGAGTNVFRCTAEGAAPATPDESPAAVNLMLTSGLGNDTASLSFFDVFTDVSLNTGLGDDSIFMKYDGVPDTRTSSLVVNTGEGNDTFQLSAASTIRESPSKAGMFIKFDGLGGNDACSMSFFDIFTEVSLDTGLGNDSIYMKYDGFAGDRLSSLVANTGDGNDTSQIMVRESPSKASLGRGLYLKYDGGAGINAATMSFFDVFTDVSLAGGAGSDRIFMKYDGIEGDSALACDLGDGLNTLQVDAQADPDAPAGLPPGTLNASVTGGIAADSVTMSFFDVFTELSLDTGAGNDSVFLKFEDGNPDQPLGTVAANTGDGNDNFQVMVRESPSKQSLGRGLYLKYDGGAGNNVATLSFFDVFTEVSLAGGTGSDRLFLKYEGLASDSSVSADLGDGNNVFQVDATGATDTAQPGVALGGLDLSLTTGLGRDAVTASFFDIFTELSVDTGAGNDSIFLKYERPSADRTSSLVLDSGAGNDSVQVSGGGDENPVESLSLMFIKIDCNDGNDACVASFFDVFPELSLDGGAGNDSIFIKIQNLRGDATAPLSVDLGDGKNVFTLAVSGDAASALATGQRSSVALSLNAGDGSDIATMSFFDVFTEVSADLGGGRNSTAILLDAPASLAGGGGGGAGGLAQNSIAVSGGAGDDRISLTLGSPASAAGGVAALGSVSASLDGGEGKNAVSFTLGGDVAQGQNIACDIATGAGADLVSVATRYGFCDGSVHVAVNTGAGNDTFSGLAIGDVNGDGRPDLAVDMGSGNDRASFQQQGAIIGVLDVLLDGGDGNDTLSAIVAAAQGSTGRFSVVVEGGLQNDLLTLRAPGAASQTFDHHYVADGGDGVDSAVITDGVTLIDVESFQIVP